ncbi:hypothetical protein GCM10009007_00760 [Formosimonas limnophila]|uniref:Activator of Hsp90 ATPase homologue 1/2-like C-terminal domain-containing protein n=1 Tax=Formosimonas limnophila TaxID=1384487 RepID=A0A8J3FZL7_9BURK|nr:hypothetical protein GCM10009007_00760 [Formosimonas limnophila]
MPDEMQVTVEFRPVLCGTGLSIVQTGIPEAIPLEFCYRGWQESLILLAQLVEPEILDEHSNLFFKKESMCNCGQ